MAEPAHRRGAGTRAQVAALLKDLISARTAGPCRQPHPPARSDLQLLRDPRGDRGRIRELPGDKRAGCRRRGRGARPRPETAGRTGAGRPNLGDGEAGDDITEREVTVLVADFATVWSELFPAEQARIVQLLVERVDVQENALELRIRAEGLASLVGELRQQGERMAA
jgi:site-specific DNA recombinase